MSEWTVEKHLVIVESPTKARTIGQFLGKEYTVIASVGHVRDLPKSNKDAVDIEHGFTPRYVVTPGKKEIIEKIAHAAKNADVVYLATDPDREGEAIAWHVEQVADLKKPKRVVFHEITRDAIDEALKHPRTVDDKLRKAQEARRVLDRIVGYDLSGLIWKKVRYGLSAGRVQSPALRILVEREREIKAFIPETYFVLSADFKSKHGNFSATASETPKTLEEAERIVRDGKKAVWHIEDVVEKAEERNPRPPFTTSTLQQSASTRLGFSPSRTMRTAQKLYEGGLITYMRTDSVVLAKEALAKIASVVEKEFGSPYVSVRAYKTKSKNAQEAHEAIRPTDVSRIKAGNTPDEMRLYELIRTRTVASQMASAKVLRTTLTVNASENIPSFFAKGARVTFPGWLALDTGARGEDVELPKVEKNETVTLKALTHEEKQTEPPNRYSEAGLIKELEKRDIGRPSTYASIIKTLEDRAYVERLNRTLIPTATGMVVSGWLEENFPKYVSDSFTAEMEDELDEIARGERTYEDTLSTFYTPFEKEVRSKEKLPKATALGKAPEEFTCPVCGNAMEFKLGRNGIFMSCTRYPDCLGARTEDGVELKPDEPIGMHPETGAPIYIKTGRFGPYVEMPLEKEESPTPERKTTAGKKRATKKKSAALKRASIPPGTDLATVTLEDAVRYLSLPRELGMHPDTGNPVIASAGRFGPYVGSDGEFRSLKKTDPYTVTLAEALELLAQPKQPPKGATIVREIGVNPKTKRKIILYKSKQGLFLKKGLRRIYLPETTIADSITIDEAVGYLK